MKRKTERLGIRVSPEDKKLWKEAAAKNGMSLSQFATAWMNEGVRILKQGK